MLKSIFNSGILAMLRPQQIHHSFIPYSDSFNLLKPNINTAGRVYLQTKPKGSKIYRQKTVNKLNNIRAATAKSENNKLIYSLDRNSFLPMMSGRLPRYHSNTFVLAARPWSNRKPPVDRKSGQPITGQRVGYLASKKTISKLAVKRNRARRRLTAAAYEILPTHAISSCDFLLIARLEALTAEFSQIKSDLIRAINTLKLARKTHPSTIQNVKPLVQ
ncbi:hypothetical protein BDF19DRAFT_498443 [Syncephalis fuscata]|nr:hypothetical protein BDF19DRAFT_498443 [Syncephalis fuscata]